jgi:hypothetical protein
MEHKTRFDLNGAIANWRQNLAAHETFDAQTLRELESHLREAIDELSAKGLPPEEAFWLATRRIGATESLATEFQKANPLSIWRTRVFWMLVGVAGLDFLSHSLQAISFTVAAISSTGTANNARSTLGYVQWFTFFGGPIAALLFCRWILLGRAQRLVEKLSSLRISRFRIGFVVANALALAHILQFFSSAYMTAGNPPNFGWNIIGIFAAFCVFPTILGALIAHVAPLPRAKALAQGS